MRESVVHSVARAESGSVIFLEPKKSDVVVPIIVRRLEEESILIGMSNIPSARPLAHDLFVSLLDKFSYRLKRIEIHEYKNELFYARLILKTRRGRAFNMDARPSDAIAIAVRLGASIYIHNQVIEDTAISMSVIQREERNNRISMEIRRNEIRVDQLEYDLQKAVEAENYEEAARIRDKIQKLR